MKFCPPKEQIDRMSIPEPNSGCWFWLGAMKVNPSGMCYGRLTANSRTVYAHRYSYETYRGPIPAGLEVCHSCDVPLCVNPDHLFVGTHKENTDDRDRKGRNVQCPILRGTAAPWSKLSDAQVATIRQMPESSRTVAKQFGITDSYVRQIRRGQYRG